MKRKTEIRFTKNSTKTLYRSNTYLNIFNEIKTNFCTDILDIILSSYLYSFSTASKNDLLQYIEECLRIYWILILYDSSILIKPKTFDFEPRKKTNII